MEDKLRSIYRLADVTAKDKQYIELFDRLQKDQNKDDICRLVEHVVQKEGSDQSGKTYTVPIVMNHIIAGCSKDPDSDPQSKAKCFPLSVQKVLAEFLVKELKTKAEDFPAQLMQATRFLSDCLEADDDYKAAALALASFKFESSRAVFDVSPKDKVRWYVDIAICFLKADDAVSASQNIKKALALLNEIEKDSDLFIEFKSCYAQVQDCERNFLGAARDYFRLSQYYGKEPDGLLQALKCAVTCAILAPAGPDRTRLLALLYADERASQLANYQMLERMLKERVIRAPELEKFKGLLAPHQMATDSEGNTVLSKAVMEHNMRAASRIYKNITFVELGVLLDISALKAEALARKMIEGKQMEGTIDQVEGTIEFEDSSSALLAWDQQINNICLSVNGILENIAKKHPQYEY